MISGAAVMAIAAVASLAATVYQITNQPKPPKPAELPPVPEAPDTSGALRTGFEDVGDQAAELRDKQRRRRSATSVDSPTNISQDNIKRKTLLGD